MTEWILPSFADSVEANLADSAGAKEERMGLNARCAAAGRKARSDRWKPLYFIELAADSSPIGLRRARAYLLSIMAMDGDGGWEWGGGLKWGEGACGRKQKRQSDGPSAPAYLTFSLTRQHQRLSAVIPASELPSIHPSLRLCCCTRRKSKLGKFFDMLFYVPTPS